MKEYPSIPASSGQKFREIENCYVFDKLDGSGIRAEYNLKQGWHKFGTRTRLVDVTDPVFGVVVPLFQETLSEALTKVAKDARWERLIVFMEFCGPNSFAGNHDPSDKKTLTVFDANLHKKGILGPRDFLKYFEDKVPTPKLLTRTKWTRGFVDQVWNGELAGVTFEGVVGKAGEGHDLVMAKAKTRAWVDRVKAKYSSAEADKIINS